MIDVALYEVGHAKDFVTTTLLNQFIIKNY